MRADGAATEMAACPAEYLALANRLADASGAVIRRYFRTPIPVDQKPDHTPVTVADREAEAGMRELIEAAFPDHGIVGEEMPTRNEGADLTWVLDPIDGTKSFITGKPIFGTLIALLMRETPILGIIDQPITGERWIGALGHPTTLNGTTVRVRPCPNLAQAALDCTTPEMFDGSDATAFEALREKAGLVRFGMDCYAYAVLATGFVDLVVEATMQLYDFAALVPVIEGAGGVITDWQGQPLGPGSDGRILAAGDTRVHEAARRILAL